MDATNNGTAFVSLIHMNRGWLYVGLAHDSTEEIGAWESMELAKAGMREKGYRFTHLLRGKFAQFVKAVR